MDWDRLNDNQSFVADYGAKTEGANFYPIDMTKEEFENWDNPDKLSMYTIRRDDEGKLQTIWYKEFLKNKLKA